MVKPADAPLSISEHNAGACDRAYAARYLSDQWPREPKIGTNTGSRLHELADAYLVHGKRPERVDPVSELFIEGLPHLPRPGSNVLVEQKRLIELGGLPWEFTPDIVTPDGSYVWDHKTTKDLRYALKEKHDKVNEWGDVKPGKISDAQTVVYLYALGHPNPTFSHIYYVKTRAILELERQACVQAAAAAVDQIAYDRARELYDHLTRQMEKARTSPKVQPYACSFTRPELEAAIVPMLHRGEKLLTLRAKHSGRNPHPLDFTPNTTRCDLYGGCPHKARCAGHIDASHYRATDLFGSDTTHSGDTDMAFQFNGTMPPVNGPAAPQQPAPAPQAQVQFSFPAPQQQAPVQQAAPQFQFPAPTPLTPPAPPAPFPNMSAPNAAEQYKQQIEQSVHYAAPAQAPSNPANYTGALPAPAQTVSDAELGAAVRVILRALKAL